MNTSGPMATPISGERISLPSLRRVAGHIEDRPQLFEAVHLQSVIAYGMPIARHRPSDSCKESKLSYLGHALVENRNGLIAAAMVPVANWTQIAQDGYRARS
jgi:hypothetical protein